MKHCIYSKVTREEKRPWGCEPLSEACLRGYCPERVDAKKLKGLVDNALDPEVRMRRTRGCERPP